MGRSARPRPQRLAEKLQQIRLALNLSQTEIMYRLGLEEDIPYTAIAGNELGYREPNLLELLRYARLANVYLEVLVDDALDLPEKLPSLKKHEGVKRG